MEFFFLNVQPSFQVVNVTGNQDICFYNFLCAHPLGALRQVHSSTQSGPQRPALFIRHRKENESDSCDPLPPSQCVQQHPQQPGLRHAGPPLPPHRPPARHRPQPRHGAQRPQLTGEGAQGSSTSSGQLEIYFTTYLYCLVLNS